MAEADEFDRSFLRLQPILAVITNIDLDHLDTYRDLDDIQDAFVTFAQKVPFFGQVILCLDDPMIQGILPRLADRRLVTYGLSPQADLQAQDLDARRLGHPLHGALGAATACSVACALPLPGTHNVQNALARSRSGSRSACRSRRWPRSFADFGGVHRRFERLGTWRGAAVVDDYAHHPTEVTATLQAARQVFRERASTSSSSRTSTRARAIRRRSSAARCSAPTARS